MYAFASACHCVKKTNITTIPPTPLPDLSKCENCDEHIKDTPYHCPECNGVFCIDCFHDACNLCVHCYDQQGSPR